MILSDPECYAGQDPAAPADFSRNTFVAFEEHRENAALICLAPLVGVPVDCATSVPVSPDDAARQEDDDDDEGRAAGSSSTVAVGVVPEARQLLSQSTAPIIPFLAVGYVLNRGGYGSTSFFQSPASPSPSLRGLEPLACVIRLFDACVVSRLTHSDLIASAGHLPVELMGPPMPASSSDTPKIIADVDRLMHGGGVGCCEAIIELCGGDGRELDIPLLLLCVNSSDDVRLKMPLVVFWNWATGSIVKAMYREVPYLNSIQRVEGSSMIMFGFGRKTMLLQIHSAASDEIKASCFDLLNPIVKTPDRPLAEFGVVGGCKLVAPDVIHMIAFFDDTKRDASLDLTDFPSRPAAIVLACANLRSRKMVLLRMWRLDEQLDHFPEQVLLGDAFAVVQCGPVSMVLGDSTPLVLHALPLEPKMNLGLEPMKKIPAIAALRSSPEFLPDSKRCWGRLFLSNPISREVALLGEGRVAVLAGTMVASSTEDHSPDCPKNVAHFVRLDTKKVVGKVSFVPILGEEVETLCVASARDEGVAFFCCMDKRRNPTQHTILMCRTPFVSSITPHDRELEVERLRYLLDCQESLLGFVSCRAKTSSVCLSVWSFGE